MYKVCLVGQDELLIIIWVLVMVIAGLICAVHRQTVSARKWKGMFQDCSAIQRGLRRELTWAKSGAKPPRD